jgi:hypothetical protein
MLFGLENERVYLSRFLSQLLAQLFRQKGTRGGLSTFVTFAAGSRSAESSIRRYCGFTVTFSRFGGVQAL